MLALYCQMKSRERKDANSKETQIMKYYTELDGFRQNNKESDSPMCRVCLQSASVYIYRQYNREEIVEALEIFSNINLNSEDQYPKHLCLICWKFIQEAILFRKTAAKSNKILNEPEKTNNSDSNNYKSDDLTLIDPNNHDNNDEIIDLEDNDDIDNQEDKNDINNQEVGIEFIQEDNDDTEEGTQNSYSHSNTHVSDDCTQIDDETIKEDLQTWTESKSKSRIKPKRMIKCTICDRIMTIKYYYNKHVLLHDPAFKQTNEYICEKCGKGFKNRQSIIDHQIIHAGSFPFKCDNCPYRGRTKDALNTHARIHTGVKKFLCIHCPARFYSTSNLKRHMFQHEKPQFQCNECDRAFHTEFLLKNHVDDVHLGIKPYVCNICGKAFGHRKKLTVHLKGVHKKPLLPRGRLPAYLVEQAKLNTQDD